MKKMSTENLPRYWFSRLYVSSHVCILALVASLGNESPLHLIITRGGDAGFWCALALALIAFFGVLDAVINDLMPDRFQFRLVKQHRLFMLMGIAIGSMCFAAIVAMESGWSVLHASLALPVLGATCLAVINVFTRGSEA